MTEDLHDGGVHISTGTNEILAFAESILFNPDHKSNEDVLNANLVSLYGALVVFGIAGYDKDQLKELTADAVDNSWDMISEVRENFLQAVKKKIN